MSTFANGLSPDQTLKRIQEETKRVRRRLTEDDHKPSDRTSREATTIDVSPSGAPVEQIIETFKDPVPATNMSSHLKNEHEAFKQR
jgi:hypothetical protein